MPVTVDCSCGTAFRAATHHVGLPARCANCGATITVPDPDAVFSQPPDESPVRICMVCGGRIGPLAVAVCRSCRTHVHALCAETLADCPNPDCSLHAGRTPGGKSAASAHERPSARREPNGCRTERCPGCGEEVAGGALRCRSCGCRLVETPESDQRIARGRQGAIVAFVLGVTGIGLPPLAPAAIVLGYLSRRELRRVDPHHSHVGLALMAILLGLGVLLVWSGILLNTLLF